MQYTKIPSDICPWKLPVPRSERFSEILPRGTPAMSFKECRDNIQGQVLGHIFGLLSLIIIWQDSLQVNPSVLIGSFLVGILPYGPFPWKRSMQCIFWVFESRAGKFKLRKENVQILSSSQRNYLKDWYFTELTIRTRNTNIHEANFIILKI